MHRVVDHPRPRGLLSFSQILFLFISTFFLWKLSANPQVLNILPLSNYVGYVVGPFFYPSSAIPNSGLAGAASVVKLSPKRSHSIIGLGGALCLTHQTSMAFWEDHTTETSALQSRPPGCSVRTKVRACTQCDPGRSQEAKTKCQRRSSLQLLKRPALWWLLSTSQFLEVSEPVPNT